VSRPFYTACCLAVALSLQLPASAKEADFPALTISAKVEEKQDAPTGDMVRTILGSGTAGYPEGTSLVFKARLKGASGYLDKQHSVRVDAQGRWEGAIDELGRNVYKGLYEACVTFDLQNQQDSILKAIRAKKQNTGIQSQSTEIQLGTAEEESREKADIEQVYARSFAAARAICEKTLAQFEAQQKEPNKLAWGDFVDDMSEDLVRVESRLGEFRRSRDNVRDTATYNEISNIIVSVGGGWFYPALSASLGFSGKGTPAEKENAQKILQGLKDKLAALDKTIGQVKIDPNWKPEEPVPIRAHIPTRLVPPVDPIGTTTPPPVAGPRPPGTSLVPKSRFGIAELGIGLAALCGLAMLVVLLKRK